MDGRREFVQQLVEFGRRLDPASTEVNAQRRAYVERLVSLSTHLPPASVGQPSDAKTQSSGSVRDTAVQPDTSPEALAPFRTLVMPHVARIMRVVAGAQALRRRSLDWRRRAVVDALGDPVGLLDLLGKGRDEVTHTHLIAAFLNSKPRGPLRELAQACGIRFEKLLRSKASQIGGLGLDSANAAAEWVVGDEGRVDVVIASDVATVFVEAKIDAAERRGQLDDYDRALRRDSAGKRDRVLVFLTAREDHISMSDAAHVRLTFRDLLLAWMPLVVQGPFSSSPLRSYLKTVATHVLGIASPGAFDTWPTSVQRACLDVLEREEPGT